GSFPTCRPPSRWGPENPLESAFNVARMEFLVSSTFAQLGVPADLVNLLAKQGITSPFPIQAATLPDALAGRDICGKAPTGSGKTLAFALAMALGLKEKAKPR